MDVKIADRLNEAAVEPYLLLGFTQRGRSRARINGVNLAAREGNFRSVSRKMKGALREQHRRLRPRNDRDEHTAVRLGGTAAIAAITAGSASG